MPSSGCQTCALDRKSTRLNSSHTLISYAVFCLKKIKRGTGELEGVTHEAVTYERYAPKRVTGDLEGVTCESVTYEVFAPNGVSVIVFLMDPAPTGISPLSQHDVLRI